jgi:tRNA(His) 5'-end guanylyltransferase
MKNIIGNKMSKDNLGDRMKSYEDSYRLTLPIRMPIILRVDGKAFHTYTKGCKRPLDQGLIDCMNVTAIALCKALQGSQIAYVQSDEISVLLNNYQTTETQPWFDNNLQKMVSVAASIASVTFTENSYRIWGFCDNAEGTGFEGMGYTSAITKPAYFDARAFVLPKEEVSNYFLWRQQDATRNSLQMLARTLYSHKELDGKDNSELKNLCIMKKIDWNSCPTSQKIGRCIVKSKMMKTGVNPKTGEEFAAERTEWVVDNNIPVFSDNRDYINKYV